MTIGTLDRARALATLGALGLSPLTEGVISKGGSLAAGAGAASLATFIGAGSMAGPIGTAVGAAVGLIATMVFGHHANYVKITHDVGMRVAMAETYRKIAGVYAGRAYGKKDLNAVWKGLKDEGFFLKSRTSNHCMDVAKCIANPVPGNCPVCGGAEQWVDDLFDSHVEDPAHRSINGVAKTALKQGLTPTQAADQIFIPHWAHQHDKFTVPWAYPNNSQNPSLCRQLIIDSLDCYMAADDPSLPVSYGRLATTVTGSTPASTAPATTAARPPAASSPASTAARPPAASSPASTVAVTTKTGTAGTVSTADLASLVRSMIAQGQSQAQAYQSSLAALNSQGINTNDAGLQSALASIASGVSAAPASAPAAASASAPATPTLTPQAAGFSPVEMILLVLVGGGMIWQTMRSRKR